MIRTAKLAPPHSVILVADPMSADVPETMGGGLIAASDGCIAIGCQSEIDGETEVVVATMEELAEPVAPAFQGELATPSGKIAVKTVLGHTIVEVSTGREKTLIHIWVNDDAEPDKVIIGVD